jgi:hypothetical protein
MSAGSPRRPSAIWPTERRLGVLGQAGGHVGGDEARGDHVHGDAAAADFLRERLAEGDDAGLRGGVVRLPALPVTPMTEAMLMMRPLRAFIMRA